MRIAFNVLMISYGMTLAMNPIYSTLCRILGAALVVLNYIMLRREEKGK